MVAKMVVMPLFTAVEREVATAVVLARMAGGGRGVDEVVAVDVGNVSKEMGRVIVVVGGPGENVGQRGGHKGGNTREGNRELAIQGLGR